MIKHYVTFLSPGTLVSESSTREIDSWDIEKAVKMSKGIVERHESRPYCFYFTTRERTDEDFDSKETKRSEKYYLGGTVKTLDDIVKENDSKNETLLLNMRSNGWDRVVETNSPWNWTSPLEPGDIVLPAERIDGGNLE